MSESIKRHLEKLSLKELSQRREALSEVLSLENIKYSREENENNGVINFIFSSEGDNNQKFLFSAHYDNYRGSSGANDNIAAVCILINLYHELTKKNIHADFLLTDGEEDGHLGAEFFAGSHDLKKYSGIINLDLCGYGDVIVIKGKIPKFTNPEILKKHNAEIVKYLPDSDDVIFRKSHVPVINIAIIPKWDVQYLKALASLGAGFLGRPPEFEMILSQMEITQTFHNGSKDNPEFVNENAMKKVYDYLVDAMTQNESEKFSFIKLLRRFVK